MVQVLFVLLNSHVENLKPKVMLLGEARAEREMCGSYGGTLKWINPILKGLDELTWEQVIISESTSMPRLSCQLVVALSPLTVLCLGGTWDCTRHCWYALACQASSIMKQITLFSASFSVSDTLWQQVKSHDGIRPVCKTDFFLSQRMLVTKASQKDSEE